MQLGASAMGNDPHPKCLPNPTHFFRYIAIAEESQSHIFQLIDRIKPVGPALGLIPFSGANTIVVSCHLISDMQ